MPKKLSKHSASVSTTTSSASATASTQPGGAPPAAAFLADGLPLPRLFVFDLDYTLWPFWVDTHVTPPLKPVPSSPSSHTTAAADRTGDTFRFYADVPAILHTLSQQQQTGAGGVRVGVASRTHAPDLAREMLKILQVAPPPAAAAQPDEEEPTKKKAEKARPRRALDLFDAGLEIYPSGKIRHMEALAKRNGVPFEEILFFDDESRNRDVETLGVTMWLVRDGVTWREVENGVREWRARRGIR